MMKLIDRFEEIAHNAFDVGKRRDLTHVNNRCRGRYFWCDLAGSWHCWFCHPYLDPRDASDVYIVPKG